MTGDNEKVSSVILGISVRVLFNFILVFVLVEGFVVAYNFSYRVFADIPYKPTVKEEWNVVIEEGSSAYDVASTLELCGVVEGKYEFLARTYLGKYQKRIVAGSYVLGPAMSPDAICRIICNVQSEETV